MGTILIVDDNPQNLYLLSVLYRSKGQTVLEAPHGQAALEVLARSPVDLVISDILMPVMDGYTFCRELRARPEGASLPFVFYTATYTDRPDEEFALSLGANEFLVKPQDPEKLWEVAQKYLEAGRIPPAPTLPLAASEEEFLRTHNQVLFNKLEQKIRELEESHKQLRTESEARLKLEIQLAEAKRLESIGQFSAMLAHDFNNILSSLQGFLSLIELDVADRPEAQENTAQALKATQRGAEMVGQLMAYSRRQTLNLRPLDLAEWVKDLAPQLRALLKPQCSLVLGELPGGLTVQGDPTQLSRVLTNLCVNARDAMLAGGTVTLDLRRVEGGQAKGPQALLRVVDTGFGMDQATLEQIFEPFFTTKSRGKGTGLGLAVVQGLVKQHGGTVQVSSVPGQGTTFEIILPLRPEAFGR